MMDADQEFNTTGESDRRALVFDPEAYRPHLAEYDLTPEQEKALLEAVWSVIVAVVDLRFRQSAADATTDIPLDRILAAMLTSPQENLNISNEITAHGEASQSAEKEDS